jgi:hypothetical protein
LQVTLAPTSPTALQITLETVVHPKTRTDKRSPDGPQAIRNIEIWLLRLRALVARAHGDAAAYTDFRDRYRAMAKTLGFEGHITWGEAMP